MKITINECASSWGAEELLNMLAHKETTDAFLKYAMGELPYMNIGVAIERNPSADFWLRQYGRDTLD